MDCKVKIVPLLALLALILLTNPPQSDANLQRLLRRQSEQESTTAASVNNDHGQPQGNHQQQPPARLYPDLPRQPPFLAPNFATGPTPFVPFGPQSMGHPPMMQQPRSMTPTERLQSQTFTSGLGKRLLSMVGIESPSEINSNDTSSSTAAVDGLQVPGNNMMRALSNSTVLQQLNIGLQSVYGGLSKMYNSTVQQQLEMLRNSFKREANTTTNPWQERMAQQVPQFFQRMALKVSEAQQNLNQVVHQMMDMRQQNGSQSEPQARQVLGGPLGNSQFFGPNEGNFFGGNNPQMAGNFFNQLGGTFGFEQPQTGQQPRDMGSQLIDFWHHQVQPQMAMIGSTVGRVWRDLTQSGALQPMMRPQQMSNTNQPNGGNEGAPSELVDSILKEVNINSPEYKLVDPIADSGNQQQPKNSMGSQMQTRIMTMQRELNHLWHGLSNSLQNALGNVRRSLNPGTQFEPANLATNDNSNANKDTADQAANEISARIKDLNKVQKDADVVYDVVQRQQQQQEQRPTFVDRFRNFIGNMDLEHVDQFSKRVGEQVMRFGNAVGDMWHQLPDRWNNFMQNMDPHEQAARLTKQRASSTNSTMKKPEVVTTN